MTTFSAARVFDPARLPRIADGLAVVLAISLPWSTSATSVLAVLWLVALIPTLDVAAMRRVATTAAGGLPILLFVLFAVGTLWSDATLGERLEGLEGYLKLLAIPLLMVQFRRSGRGLQILYAVVGSSIVLMALSWIHARWSFLIPWQWMTVGVPVKDYIAQSGFFAFAALVLLGMAIEHWRAGRARIAAADVFLALLFFANLVVVVTGRTSLIVVPILLVLLGLVAFGWRGVVGAGVLAGVLIAGVWLAAPQLRERVATISAETLRYRDTGALTSGGFRLEFWRTSIDAIQQAPILGHGTGSVRSVFHRMLEERGGPPEAVTSNPHNQIFAVAVQVGIVGAGVLFAMWIAHLALFRTWSLISWAGLAAVVQNIVSSLFNSHISDFTQGWFYAVMVGAIGGTILGLRERDDGSTATAEGRNKGLWPVNGRAASAGSVTHQAP